MDQFKREDMFKDDLSELDESREVVDGLVQEYEAATQPNYLSWQGNIHRSAKYCIKILLHHIHAVYFLLFFAAQKPTA